MKVMMILTVVGALGMILKELVNELDELVNKKKSWDYPDNSIFDIS